MPTFRSSKRSSLGFGELTIVSAPWTLGFRLREWFPMALHLLEGLFFGTQSAQQVLQQRERLLALGVAGHEQPPAGRDHAAGRMAGAGRHDGAARDAGSTRATLFSGASAKGNHGAVGVAFHLGYFEAGAEASFRRYDLSITPEPNATTFAAGAQDDVEDIKLWIGGSY